MNDANVHSEGFGTRPYRQVYEFQLLLFGEDGRDVGAGVDKGGFEGWKVCGLIRCVRSALLAWVKSTKSTHCP
jgi:hypothetical protein